MNENSINHPQSPLNNPFDEKHFITQIIRQSEALLFDEKELEHISFWFDPDIKTEEKHKRIATLPPGTIQRLLLNFMKSVNDDRMVCTSLRSIWENNLDMTSFHDEIIPFCLSADEHIAMEACTILKENISFENPSEIEKILLKYEEKQFARPYLYEMFKFALENKTP
ncbi:MAG: hypothetical protein N3F09_02795 [Bacteroidia bacterium]|nr:hypothetical protein [Bacteroidia bacterium]